MIKRIAISTYFVLLTTMFVVACGGYFEDERTEIVFEDEKPKPLPKVYTWADMKKACFNCHNSSAPPIPLDEAGFRASPKVRARIQDDTMPPNKSGFVKSKALEYLQ